MALWVLYYSGMESEYLKCWLSFFSLPSVRRTFRTIIRREIQRIKKKGNWRKIWTNRNLNPKQWKWTAQEKKKTMFHYIPINKREISCIHPAWKEWKKPTQLAGDKVGGSQVLGSLGYRGRPWPGEELRPEDGRRRKRLKGVVDIEIVSSAPQTKDAQSRDSPRRAN